MPKWERNGISCKNISKYYWYADRIPTSSGNNTYFYIRVVEDNRGNLNTKCPCYVQGRANNNSFAYSQDESAGLRPVFILRNDIHYVISNGTKTLIQ